MENITVEYSNNRVSGTRNSPIIINNVTQVYATRSDYSNIYCNVMEEYSISKIQA